MEPLYEIKQTMIWYNMCSPDENPSFRMKMAQALFRITNWFLLSSGVFTSALYFVKNFSIDLGESLYSGFVFSGIGNAFYVYLLTMIFQNGISKIFIDLSHIYDHFKNEDTYRFLVDANSLNSKLFRYCIIFILMYAADLTLVCCFSVAWCYYEHGTILMNNLFIPFRFSLPWDPRTSTGYVLDVIYSDLMILTALPTAGLVHMLFVGMGLHHRAFYRIFRQSAMNMNSQREIKQAAEHLRHLVRSYIMFKKWFMDSAKTYSFIVFVELISCVISGSLAIFKLDFTFRENGLNLEGTLFIFGALICVLYLFLYCFMGKMASDSYAWMADCLYESNWIELRNQNQKYILLMIQNAQQPIHYTGFGVAILNMETFGAFLRAIVSYFMIFKTVTF